MFFPFLEIKKFGVLETLSNCSSPVAYVQWTWDSDPGLADSANNLHHSFVS